MNIGKHGVRCIVCRVRKTYRQSKVCRACEPDALANKAPGRPMRLPDPAFWPEDYLVRCAQELQKRLDARQMLLTKLGIREAA